MKMIEYQESFGKIAWQEGFPEELAGRSLEAQRRCFAFTKHRHLTQIPYQELENELRKEPGYLEGITPIPEQWYLIAKEGILCGAAYEEYALDQASGQWNAVGYHPVLPYGRYQYDSSSDNNGSGYKTRAWYRYLVCLPYDHTLW